jgi:hypothetical protein
LDSWSQHEELRRLSQQIHFLNGKARGAAKRKKVYFHLVRRVRRLRKRLLRDLELVRRNLEGRADLPPSRSLKGEEALCLIAEDLAALEQAANVCERRVMEQEKVPMAEKIISLSDSDASFIVKGGWNSVVGYRPQLARSGLCHRAGVASGQRGRQPTPCSDGQGADHQHRSHSFDGQRR